MKPSLSLLLLLIVAILTTAGCQVIGDIFKAGVWVGVILVVAVIGLIAWVVSKSTG